MVTVNLSKHDEYVQRLRRDLTKGYDSISTHVPIKDSKRELAEIDILAEKDGELDAYEVKCSFRITKAKQQAKKIRKHVKLRNFFFYCGSSGELVML